MQKNCLSFLPSACKQSRELPFSAGVDPISWNPKPMGSKNNTPKSSLEAKFSAVSFAYIIPLNSYNMPRRWAPLTAFKRRSEGHSQSRWPTGDSKSGLCNYRASVLYSCITMCKALGITRMSTTSVSTACSNAAQPIKLGEVQVGGIYVSVYYFH